MRTLGVHVTADIAYIAVADRDTLLEATPHFVCIPQGIRQDEQLTASRDDVRKIIAANSIQRINVISPESTYKATYNRLVDRITLETIFAFAAAESGISFRRISRPFVRSTMKFPQAGPLSLHADSFRQPLGPYWKNKRSLAAVAALCGGGE